MKKKNRIVVIDSGISKLWRNYKCVISNYTFDKDTMTLVLEEAKDFIGHGTAVADVMYQYNSNIEIISVRLCGEEEEANEEELLEILSYFSFNNLDIDIINISAGISYIQNYKKMERLCLELVKKGIYIVSAFDNDGAVSYPAAFDEVIGVDITDNYQDKKDLIRLENSIVNVLVPDIYYRTIWNKSRAILKGTSFAAAKVTALLAKKLLENPELRYAGKDLTKLITNRKKREHFTGRINLPKHKIKKAIVFPVNKETQALLRYNDLLYFEIIGVYDDKYSGNVGRIVFGYTIKSYESINWKDDFDTVILSCVYELSKLTKIDYADIILKKSIETQKYIYTFEEINTNYKRYFYPSVTRKMVNYKNELKMNKISKPVLCIMGTSSRQGKFSLQLEIIRRLRKGGYNVGHISTEPSGYLFGADFVFHSGYRSFLPVEPWESITIVNRMMFETQIKGRDIIITGCQSGTIHYNNSLVEHFGIFQYAFLLGAMPDFIILCINAHDDEEYIERTINFINSVDEGKIRALVIYPIEITETVSGIQFKRNKLTSDKVNILKDMLKNKYRCPAYLLGKEEDMQDICKQIIDYFADEEEKI